MDNDKEVAVLIDAENISPKYLDLIFEEANEDGLVTYKRTYGDWTTPNMNSWKEELLKYGLQPIQQFANTHGKNSSDSALIIDAMDILYKGNVDVFCLCTSDSDFTRLASRLRESGKIVIGMGETKTPEAFVKSCNRFKHLDLIGAEAKKEDEKAEAEAKTKAPKPKEATSGHPSIDDIKEYVKKIISESGEGSCLAGKIGEDLKKKFPNFDARNYKFPSLSSLLKKLGFKATGGTKEDLDNGKPLRISL